MITEQSAKDLAIRGMKEWKAGITNAGAALQEVLDPRGQVSAGISIQVLKNKGTVRLVMLISFILRPCKD